MPGPYRKVKYATLVFSLVFSIATLKFSFFTVYIKTEHSDPVRTLALDPKFTGQTAAYVGAMCKSIFWECQDITENRPKIGFQRWVAPSVFGALIE